MLTAFLLDSVYIQGRVLLCILHGAVLYDIWAGRENFCFNLMHSVSKMWPPSTKRKTEGTINASFLDELRLKNTHTMLTVLRRFSLSLAMLLAVVLEASDNWPRTMPTRLTFFLAAHFSLAIWSAYPLKQNHMDIFFLAASCFQLILIAVAEPERLLLNGVARHCFRALLGVFYMKSHVSASLNLLLTVATCWAFLNREELCVKYYQFSVNPTVFICGSEAFAWACTSVLCAITETWFAELRQNAAQANGAKHAMERLLVSLCDAVVRLDAELRITQASPQLIHLMCPTKPLLPEVLEGSLLSNMLASPSDKDKFSAFVSGTQLSTNSTNEAVKGPAPALRVCFHHPLGREVPVEFFHVHVDSQDDDAQHLIGIREVRKDGVAPDESLFQGRGTAFVHSVDANAHPENPQSLITSVLSNQGPNKSPHSSQNSSGRIARVGCWNRNVAEPRSHSSGSSGRATHQKRKITGLTTAKFKFKFGASDLGIQEYALCCANEFEDHEQEPRGVDGLPAFESCLVRNAHSDKFWKWLQESTNSLLNGDAVCFDYPDQVAFRPPNAVCVSPKIILCSDSVRLSRGVAETSDIDDDDGMTLELYHISQLIPCRSTTSKVDYRDLPGLSEQDGDS